MFQRQGSLPTRIHIIGQPIFDSWETKFEYNECPFQGTQIRALLTYFLHHTKWDGYMIRDSS
jgi:hypothetical protein